MSATGNHLRNVTTGVLLGALIGGGIGLGACMLIFDEAPLFTGDTVLAGALLCGTLGFLLGEGFIEWLKESWWHFW